MSDQAGVEASKMMSGPTQSDRCLIAVIGDEDTVTGFLLTGVGHKFSQAKSNFFIVDEKTTNEEIESKIKELVANRSIAMILINQWIADRVRLVVDSFAHGVPTIIEISSRNHPYDATKDSVIKLANKIMGSD